MRSAAEYSCGAYCIAWSAKVDLSATRATLAWGLWLAAKLLTCALVASGELRFNAAQLAVGVDLVAEPLVGRHQPVAQLDLRRPAESAEARDVEQLARRAVGLGGVPHEFGAGVDDLADGLGQLLDRHVDAGADVDVRVIVVVLHQE